MPSNDDLPSESDTMFCGNCGEQISRNVRYCPECGQRNPGSQSDTERSPFNQTNIEKNPAIAAVLSFVIVGLGQVYNGQLLRGIALHISMWFLAIFAVFFFWLAFPLLFVFLLWVFNVFDAYNQAKKLDEQASS